MARRRTTGGGEAGLEIHQVGKLFGLVLSVLFLILAILYLALLLTGALPSATDASSHLFYILLIVLGGPIPYFFASSADKVELKTPMGKVVLGGGYAVVVAAMIVVIWVLPTGAWRQIEVKVPPEDATVRDVQVVDSVPAGSEVYKVESDAPGRLYKCVCYFGPNIPEIKARFTLVDDYGPRDQLFETDLIPRGGDPLRDEPFTLREVSE